MVNHVLLRYFTPSSLLPSSGSVPSLMPESLREANKRVASLCEETSPVPKRSKTAYTSYSAEDRACIGKYAAEHGPTKASRHFSSLFERPVPESTAHLLKKQYLMELKNKRRDGDIPEVKSLPTKVCGCPLLLGSTLDGQVKEYIIGLSLSKA